MLSRWLPVGLVLGLVTALLLLLFVALALAAPRPAPSASGPPAESSKLGAFVVARAISIPFGIADQVDLGADGSLAAVSGHGDCLGGESYVVQVMVKQAGQPTVVALGTTDGDCPAGAFTWMATALTAGVHRLAAGEAEVCANARVSRVEGRTATRHWCVDVTLVD